MMVGGSVRKLLSTFMLAAVNAFFFTERPDQQESGAVLLPTQLFGSLCSPGSVAIRISTYQIPADVNDNVNGKWAVICTLKSGQPAYVNRGRVVAID